MVFKFNETLPAEYQSLAVRCGQKVPAKSANRALQNSIFCVGVYDGDVLAAFGRICGDGVLCFMVCDIMVDDRYRQDHLEKQVLQELNEYLREVVTKESCVTIHVSAEFGTLCRLYGYRYMDEDYEVVMRK